MDGRASSEGLHVVYSNVHKRNIVVYTLDLVVYMRDIRVCTHNIRVCTRNIRVWQVSPTSTHAVVQWMAGHHLEASMATHMYAQYIHLRIYSIYSQHTGIYV